MAEQQMAEQTEARRWEATVRNVRISPRKARLVVDLIRGRSVVQALGILDSLPKRSAPVVKTLLKSAIANAEHLGGNEVEVDELKVRGAWVNPARTLKRFMPRAMGRATPIRKRSCHITLQVG
jgi:large subunit ribosomal protein L22